MKVYIGLENDQKCISTKVRPQLIIPKVATDVLNNIPTPQSTFTNL